MSLVRYGTKCEEILSYGELGVCASPPCPGSDVYIYEAEADHFVCSGCSIVTVEPRALKEFRTDKFSEMRTHLEEHRKRGEHVPESIVDFFRSDR